MPHTHDLYCIDGCGQRLGEVTLPDGVLFKGNDHYGLMVPDHARVRTDAQEAVRKEAERVEFTAKMEASFGSSFVLSDDDPLDVNPGIWKRITDLFRR